MILPLTTAQLVLPITIPTVQLVLLLVLVLNTLITLLVSTVITHVQLVRTPHRVLPVLVHLF
jgi:hypothetical protein